MRRSKDITFYISLFISVNHNNKYIQNKHASISGPPRAARRAAEVASIGVLPAWGTESPSAAWRRTWGG